MFIVSFLKFASKQVYVFIQTQLNMQNNNLFRTNLKSCKVVSAMTWVILNRKLIARLIY